MKPSVLLYKLGFMLDEFAQLQVNVNAMNTIKTGYTKPEHLVGKYCVLETWDVVTSAKGLSGWNPSWGEEHPWLPVHSSKGKGGRHQEWCPKLTSHHYFIKPNIPNETDDHRNFWLDATCPYPSQESESYDSCQWQFQPTTCFCGGAKMDF